MLLAAEGCLRYDHYVLFDIALHQLVLCGWAVAGALILDSVT